MQQITMRRMNFNDPKTRIERKRGWIALTERYRARGHDRPAVREACEPRATLPWQLTARLAARMCKLNSGNGALRVDEAGDARERLNLLVAPQAHISRRDSAVARNR